MVVVGGIVVVGAAVVIGAAVVGGTVVGGIAAGRPRATAVEVGGGVDVDAGCTTPVGTRDVSARSNAAHPPASKRALAVNATAHLRFIPIKIVPAMSARSSPPDVAARAQYR